MITFQKQEVQFRLQGIIRLKKWISAVVTKEKKECGNLSFVFMDDQTLLSHNQQFLGHDTYTDIITFDYREGKQVNGDILISVERVRENAGKFDVAFDTELRRVMIHGVLHLCGYKDKKKEDQVVMRKKENAALRLFDKEFSSAS
jgi:probable rRNA maturation factor